MIKEATIKWLEENQHSTLAIWVEKDWFHSLECRLDSLKNSWVRNCPGSPRLIEVLEFYLTTDEVKKKIRIKKLSHIDSQP